MSSAHCDNAQSDMIAYLDRALTTSDSFEIERHLESCQPCQQELAALCAMDEALQSIGHSAAHDVTGIDIRAKLSSNIADLSQTAQKSRLTAPPDEATLHAYLEDDLETLQNERIAQFIATQPHIRQELLGIGAIQADIEAVAVEEAQFRLDDDLTDDVMRAIHYRQADSVFRRRSAARIWLRAGLAAACLLVGWWLYSLSQQNDAPNMLPKTALNDQNENEANLAANATNEANQATEDKSQQETTDSSNPLETTPTTPLQTPTSAEDATPPTKRRGSFREAVGLYRLALLKDVKAMERIVGWASLDPAESQELLAGGRLSPGAKVGLADFLPTEEGVEILEAAVRDNPGDPYLRSKLARHYAAMEGHSEDRLAQLEAWSELDPDNSLPHFLTAQSLLEQDDTAGALASLDHAMALNLSDVFSRASALDREQTLLANGTDPQVARFLAVATAGTQEYTDYVTLGGSLLQFGDYYTATNQNETAGRIIIATQQFGTQVASSASLTNEQVAGLDIQLDALNALQALYALIEQPEEDTENLLARTSQLLRDLADLADLITLIGEFFGQADDTQITDALDSILENGDIGLIETFGN